MNEGNERAKLALDLQYKRLLIISVHTLTLVFRLVYTPAGIGENSAHTEKKF